jgi:hypothetical protein
MANKILITASELRELMTYDPDAGIFVWKVTNSPRALAGSVAGCCDKQTGYVLIRINKIKYYAHRLAWLYMTGEWPTNIIDHWNANESDNSWENLRVSTKSKNAANMKKPSHNTSGLKGVYFRLDTLKWTSTVTIMKKHINLGCVDCPAAAHFAYVIEADKQFGEFARAA